MNSVPRRYLTSLADRTACLRGGSKARGLHFLIRHGFAVAPGWVLSWDALDDFERDGDRVMASLRLELLDIIRAGQAYAIRSSASVEDAGESSCAGLFHSRLAVTGLDAVLASIRLVWQSRESPEFLAYRARSLADGTPVRMAVIIQEMVPACLSGVAFSRNPLTGLSETIIEAGCGTGEQQAAARQDPERWVAKWGRWLERPQPGAAGEDLALEIVRQTAAIARSYGRPVDLEWAWDGNALTFLQVRPITRLDIPVFSNRIAREMLPGIIKPLVWSVNTGLINPTWTGILTRLTGDRSFKPDDLTGHFYYRAYFNMGVFGRAFERLGMPSDALELLYGLEQDGPDKPKLRPELGILPRLPRLLAFAAGFLAIERPFRRLVCGQMDRFSDLARQMVPDRSPPEWLAMVEQLTQAVRPVARYNILVPMQTMMYYRLLASLLKRQGHDARALELDGREAAGERLDPQASLERLQRKYAGVPDASADARLDDDVARFLERFGHFSDSGNDCSSVPWRETPGLIRQMILLRPTATGGNGRPPDSQKLTLAGLELPGWQGALTGMVYCRASRFAVHRAEISSLYTYGYGLFRTCFQRLGAQLAAEGVLEGADDIFYLYLPELAALVEAPVRTSQRALVSQRQAEIERCRDAVLPETIYGREQPPVQHGIIPALRGIPTSLGTYTGPVRVLSALTEFERLRDGDVLVVPYSDVGWMPLFARAGAVIAESGGILSHSSIVAREYRIPAVVSVYGACRMADGTLVTVNGFTGDIVVSGQPDRQTGREYPELN